MCQCKSQMLRAMWTNLCIHNVFNHQYQYHTTVHVSKQLQALFFKLTLSLLKLSNSNTHRDETWYACVLHHFQDNCIFAWYLHVCKQQQIASDIFILLLSNSSTHGDETLYACVLYILIASTLSLKLLLHSSNLHVEWGLLGLQVFVLSNVQQLGNIPAVGWSAWDWLAHQLAVW